MKWGVYKRIRCLKSLLNTIDFMTNEQQKLVSNILE